MAIHDAVLRARLTQLEETLTAIDGLPLHSAHAEAARITHAALTDLWRLFDRSTS